eukprot:CAMPEP_0117661952 /NCGR_PEP_ID=MMETSP0804-20121206/7805_1 /TAXON_ID=1074897 /ORGANISM="Tetraselmis astigmatica, Strain CCMP880" /LENGTH=50 /DNA_ID=CAMNT_0005468841 /DNA_START=192 /DNA_END=344 /DNA_ORIENTATION=+
MGDRSGGGDQGGGSRGSTEAAGAEHPNSNWQAVRQHVKEFVEASPEEHKE